MSTYFDAVIERMKQGKRFLVVSHVNPEGDAVGSLLGLTLALRSIGKEAVAYLEDPNPDIFDFLPGSETIVHTLDGEAPFDATFAVDCGQMDRLGENFNKFEGMGPVLNLDHHTTNDNFGELNVVFPDASSTGEVIFDFCKEASIEITKEMAINLYVAIHTDTGSFRYSCTSEGSLKKAGELVGLGVDPWAISTQVYENHPASKYKLLARVLSTLNIIEITDADHLIATLYVTDEMFDSTGADKGLADGFVNYARGIEGVEAGVLFRETGPDEYKVSFRSKGDVDVADVALGFGGGGHSHAAGCSVTGKLEMVMETVVEALKTSLAG